MRIAVIPARGGSKRIPAKNIRDFMGTPVLQLTIEKIIKFNFFQDVYVSTEDEATSEIAINCGAKILKRETSLSNDFATTLDVMHDAVNQLRSDVVEASDYVTCIYPVTPLLKFKHLQEAFRILEKVNEGYVFVAQNQSAQMSRSFYFNDIGKIEMLFPAQEKIRTQDVTQIYSDAGLFYTGKASTWLSRIPLFGPESRFVEIGKYDSVDIDTEEDWKFAEELFRIRMGNAQEE